MTRTVWLTATTVGSGTCGRALPRASRSPPEGPRTLRHHRVCVCHGCRASHRQVPKHAVAGNAPATTDLRAAAHPQPPQIPVQPAHGPWPGPLKQRGDPRAQPAAAQPGPSAAGVDRRGPPHRRCRSGCASHRPRLTHLLAHAQDMPISAATWAIGRVRHRSTSPGRPSTLSGALEWVTAAPSQAARQGLRRVRPASARP